MSSGSGGGSECSLDADDLLEMRTRFDELTKEKEKLRDSQSESFELIRRLELHGETLSKAREADKKRIEELERELSNCCQEIDYLQDQLKVRNMDPVEEVERLREQLRILESERSLLSQELEDKEVVIRQSASHIEKLEEAISSIGLEYQWDIESTKLESAALEQNLFETNKLLEKSSEENSRMSELIQDLELRNQDAYIVIQILEKENKDLKEKLQTSDVDVKSFVWDMEEQFHDCLDINGNQSSSKRQTSSYGNIFSPLISKLPSLRMPDTDMRNKIAKMSLQIDEYEQLVKQLKEELRKEKLKAKEEAEDLTQEMAELRYQLTSMLDEECKRRANIEQISLHRIAELEAQIAKEQQKSIVPRDLVVRNQ